jgi:hypothetical protein
MNKNVVYSIKLLASPGDPGVQEVEKTGNVLSKTESQGFRKQTGFGPELN